MNTFVINHKRIQYHRRPTVGFKLPRNVHEELVLEDRDRDTVFSGQLGFITYKTLRKIKLKDKITVKPLLTYYGAPDKGPPEQAPMEREEELRLFRIHRRSAKARDLLVNRYLCWAFKIAAKLKGPRLEFDEAVSAANAGLMEAIEGYDPDSGYRFTTYSAIIIRRHVINALVATYPVKINDRLRKRFALRAKLDPKELDKLLTHDEPRSLGELFERLAETPEFDVETLSERSEDAPFMPYEAPNPANACESSGLPIELQEAMHKLAPVEHEVLRRHYQMQPPQTFDVIALRLNKTKAAVRDIHDRALAVLKKHLTT